MFLLGTAVFAVGRRLSLPELWTSDVAGALFPIDTLDGQIDGIEAELRRSGADHPSVPLLMSAPGLGWVLASTIAVEVGKIEHFSSSKKLFRSSGLCPTVCQSARKDHWGSLSMSRPRHLCWALIEAATHVGRHRAYGDHSSAPPRASVASGARRLPGSRWLASSPRPSGTC